MKTSVSELLHEARMAAPHLISVRSDSDIIAARMAARDMARSMGFSAIDQARIATATSELTRNILIYAGEGTVTLSQVQRDGRSGIEMVFADQGPGIAEVEQSLQNGTSAGGIPGMGLAGTRRLMDEMDIESTIGVGTRITCRKWLS